MNPRNLLFPIKKELIRFILQTNQLIVKLIVKNKKKRKFFLPKKIQVELRNRPEEAS